MKTRFLLLLLAISTWLIGGEISPSLAGQMRSTSSFIPINVVMQDQFDWQSAQQNHQFEPHYKCRSSVARELKEFSEQSQFSLMEFLKTASDNGSVRSINPMWIVNMIRVEALPSVIEQIAARSDVKSIDDDELRQVLDTESLTFNVVGPEREIPWNISRIRANSVWSLNYTGSGIVVALIDTGVNYNHTDLADHLWTAPGYPYHGYDFANNDNNPLDDVGHGTACAGIVAGDGHSGCQTGVAPDASIMALKVLDHNGQATESSVWLSWQFALENGAELISMSFGWMHAWDPNRTAWRTASNNLLAASIPVVVSAGNEGTYLSDYPVPDNIRTPADCPPPWRNPDQTISGGQSAVIAVGASNNSDVVPDFSSHGPVTWSNVNPYNDYTYSGGNGLIRPDIIAPGLNIKTLHFGTTNGYLDGWWGTSMAAPHVAGVIALMLSKNPSLTPAQIDQIIEENCYAIGGSKSNLYGSGRIDALQAVNTVPLNEEPPFAALTPTPADNAYNSSVFTSLSWQNGGGANSYRLYLGTDNPPTSVINGAIINSTSSSASNNLQPFTRYYWRVDSCNNYGTTTGNIWSFTTGSGADESFETGDFTHYNWTTSGDANWYITSEEALHGNYCARSGHISNNQSTSLVLSAQVISSGNISFYVKTSCENDPSNNYDHLTFYIDDVEIQRWDGVSGWLYASFQVAVGQREFRWTYSKDAYVYAGSDCAWLDFITFPPLSGTLMPPVNLTGIAGVSGVELNWNAPVSGTPTGYNVYRNSIRLGTGAVGTTSYQDSDLPPAIYNYYVKAVYPQGESSASNLVQVEVSAAQLLVPDNLNVTATCVNHLHVSWNRPRITRSRNLTGYRVYVNGNLLDTINDPSQLQYTSQGVAPGSYSVSVSAVYTQGESNQTSAATITINLVAPTQLEASLVTGNVYLNWNFERDLSDFVIYRDYNQIGTSSNGSFIDSTPFAVNQSSVTYRVTARYNGTWESGFSNPVQVDNTTATQNAVALTQDYLGGCVPNPFNPVTSIRFGLAKPGMVKLEVYNLLGQKVRVLANRVFAAGQQNIVFNGRDDQGRSLPSGIYFTRLQTGQGSFTNKMILLK